MMNKDSSQSEVYYTAAGGVVVHEKNVLVLFRPGKNEVRLPKGHIKSGEDAPAAACREVTEESGYVNLEIVKDLGTQIVEFDYQGDHIVRRENYFLMTLVDQEKLAGEKQFKPAWLRREDALRQLTFAAEREWVRRAYEHLP